MKRILSLSGVLLSLACFFGCVVALTWMWSIKQPVIEKSTHAFQKADEVLAVAEKTIDNVKGNLETSRNHLLIVRTSAVVRNDETGFFERTFARAAAKQVAPNVIDVQHSLEKVTEASIVVNSILESLHDIEGVPNLDNNQVRALQDKLDSVNRASSDLGDLLEDPRRKSNGESAAERSERIAANLELVIGLAVEFQKGVTSLRKKLQYYQAKSLWWMEHGPVYVSVGLGWVMFSQVVVLAVSLRGFRRKTAYSA
jgi:hypothetical protein